MELKDVCLIPVTGSITGIIASLYIITGSSRHAEIERTSPCPQPLSKNRLSLTPTLRIDQLFWLFHFLNLSQGWFLLCRNLVKLPGAELWTNSTSWMCVALCPFLYQCHGVETAQRPSKVLEKLYLLDHFKVPFQHSVRCGSCKGADGNGILDCSDSREDRCCNTNQERYSVCPINKSS